MLVWLDARDGSPPPKVYVASFPELLKRVRKQNSAGDRREGRVPISNTELAWLKRLHDDVRNQFLHFQPMHWSLEVSGLPELAVLAARLIEEIAELGWAFRHQDDAWLTDLRASIDDLRTGA